MGVFVIISVAILHFIVNNLLYAPISIFAVFAPGAFCRHRVVNCCNTTRRALRAAAKQTTNTPRGTLSRLGSNTLPKSPQLIYSHNSSYTNVL